MAYESLKRGILIDLPHLQIWLIHEWCITIGIPSCCFHYSVIQEEQIKMSVSLKYDTCLSYAVRTTKQSI